MTINTTTSNNFYIYAHYKPDGNIFYIGKGRNKRAWNTYGRNMFWHNTINKHGGYEVVLLYENLSEEDALRLEKEEITFWGRRKDGGFLINLTDGGEGTSGRKFTQEQLNRHKTACRVRAQTDAWKNKHIAAMKKMQQNETYRVNNRIAMQKLAQDETWKANQKIAGQKRAQNETWKANVKAGRQKWLADEVRQAEWKAKQKAAMQKYTKDRKYKKRKKSTYVPEKKECILVSPDGTVHHIYGIKEFCRMHGLNTGCINFVRNGKYKHHKGWKKYIPPDNNHLINQFTL
jgi:hypothetical protein